MPFCPKCGDKYEGEVKFCPGCGSKIGEPTLASNSIAAAIDEEKILWQGKQANLTARLKETANLNSTTYTLTNQRLIIKSGLIGKKEEQIDLVRIKDIMVKQSLKDRALGVGEILITSSDPSTPKMILLDIREPNEVKEILRNAIRSEKSAQGISFQERL